MEVFDYEIQHLIELKQEGNYWDFKRQWYSHDKNADLLHDILCMSNNLVNHDAYIIIGVDEDDFTLNDIVHDTNRKNTQNIIDFLKDKKFAGDVRPLVLVKQVSINGVELDVIVIKNSVNTPFFLKERFQSVNANSIYTRIQDTNTPINMSADIDKVEYLWKKRFGLIQTPIEKLEIYLNEPDNWINWPDGKNNKYYKYFPEYTLSYDCDSSRDGYEYYFFFQTDTRPRFLTMKLFYHQTLLIEFVGVFLDGSRYVTPCPNTDGISFDKYSKWDIMFKYMEKDSFLYKFNKFLYKNEYTDEARIAREKFLKCILVFENKQERVGFKYYVKENWKQSRNIYIDDIHIPYIPQLGNGYKKDAFKDECENILILQKMLIDYRGSISKS